MFVIKENLVWAREHGEEREGDFYCRKTGKKMGMYEIKIDMWEVDPERSSPISPDDLKNGRLVEPIHIHHFCCHACGIGERIKEKFLSVDLEWTPEHLLKSRG